MLCLHPYCPMKATPGSWDEAVDDPAMKVKPALRVALLADLNARFGAPASPAVARPPPPVLPGQLKTLFRLCPCLFNQIDVSPTARGVVHLCEVTLGGPITSANVHQAFLIQHPKAPGYAIPPLGKARSGGAIMEMLCSETLASAGLPAMRLGKDRWPKWSMPGHVLLNEGKMAALKALGDILVAFDDEGLIIFLEAADTKSKREESCRLPREFASYMRRYLDEVRPNLLNGHIHDGLWASRKGGPILGGRIYSTVRKRILDRFGKDMCLHDVRRAAATYIAIDMPEKIGFIPGVLQHSDPEVGEQHYNLANGMKASERYATTMSNLKSSLRSKFKRSGR